jgi:hypothetical protein
MDSERLIASLIRAVMDESVDPVRYYNEASKLVEGALLIHPDRVAEFIIQLHERSCGNEKTKIQRLPTSSR